MLSEQEFDAAVDDAMDSIPEELFSRLINVVFDIVDEPTPEQHALACGGDLLGLYVGVPLPKRTSAYGSAPQMPDRIFIFRRPIMRHSTSRQHASEQIRRVVLHEVGHYFGIDDDRLHELGY